MKNKKKTERIDPFLRYNERKHNEQLIRENTRVQIEEKTAILLTSMNSLCEQYAILIKSINGVMKKLTPIIDNELKKITRDDKKETN